MQNELVQYLYMVHRPCRRGKRRAALVVARTAWLHLALLVQALGWTTKGSSSKRTEEEHVDDRTALSVIFEPVEIILWLFICQKTTNDRFQDSNRGPLPYPHSWCSCGACACPVHVTQPHSLTTNPFCGCQSTHGSPKITLWTAPTRIDQMAAKRIHVHKQVVQRKAPKNTFLIDHLGMRWSSCNWHIL